MLISPVNLPGLAEASVVGGMVFFSINLAGVNVIHKKYFILPLDFTGAAESGSKDSRFCGFPWQPYGSTE